MQNHISMIDYKQTVNLPQTQFPMKGDGARREVEIQKFWFDNKVYEKALLTRKKQNKARFLLHDGPPYLSSGNIHIGTALNKILKDIIVKYKTLQGYYSPYLPGFDCHGLPIESAVLKEKQKTKDSLISPQVIRNECTDFVLKNRKLQEEKFKRLGVLGNWDNAYMTIDPKFEATQLQLFGQMVENGFIYRGLKPVFWCSSCQTALAEAEVEYVENHKSNSIYVTFPITRISKNVDRLKKYNDLKVVIWTTTPWTIPGNLAICLSKDFEYAVIQSKTFGYLLLAKELCNQFSSKINEECLILDSVCGKELEGTICKHPLYDRESPIIFGEHVTLETGTGCVHTAPGHGLEDFVIGYKYGLKTLSPVDSKGHLTIEAGSELNGLYVHKGGNEKVIELLSRANALVKEEDYFHSYPYCWRSKTPIIFRATEQWFCSIEPFRKTALEQIDKVNWIPQIGRNRIYAMVESRTDWCISRQRVWGVPIPAFYCAKCSKVHLNQKIINHISALVASYGTNIWWEKTYAELIPSGYLCDCGSSEFVKEKDTMDVWFDSGSTHLTVVDQVNDLGGSPSEMYLEGSDQHRGWFQSSLLTSVAVRGVAPYKSVLTHGFVLDESGRKMSKSLGNVVDPQKVINEFGADILRLWVASTDYSSDMRIGHNMLKQLAEVYRNIRNTARFLLGNLYDFDPTKNIVSYDKLWNIDKYILHKLEILKEQITDSFDSYEFCRYYQILQNFCAVDLSSFYFDLLKDRLYTAGVNSSSRRSAQTVLSEILNVLVRVLCPVLPHLSEDIWKHIPEAFTSDVVKIESALCLDWPAFNSDFKNDTLARDFENLLLVKNSAYKALEMARTDKTIGKSTEAKLVIVPKNEKILDVLKKNENELATIFIVSQFSINNVEADSMSALSRVDSETCFVFVVPADGEKCPRCWKHSQDIGQDSKHKTICVSCAKAVEGID